MYSIDQIKRLQVDEDYYSTESNKYCLTQNFVKDNLTFQDVENHCNFCILRILNDYKNGFLSSDDANELIDQIDVFEYSKDLLGAPKVIDKLNREIIQERLHLPYFNQLCVKCDELYDFDK